jgi:hypothetical protein
MGCQKWLCLFSLYFFLLISDGLCGVMRNGMEDISLKHASAQEKKKESSVRNK